MAGGIKEYRPRVGVIGLAYPGYNLGEELCESKLQEMYSSLGSSGFELCQVSQVVTDEATAARVGKELSESGVDCILAVITTFVPDHFIVRVLDNCDVPIFLWCVERELRCISLVCGPLITATLFELDKSYWLAGADIGDSETLNEFCTFARAAMLVRVCGNMRVGYVGGKNEIMLSMSADDYTLKRKMGLTVVDRPSELFFSFADAVSSEEASGCWSKLRGRVGQVCAAEADCLLSSRYYMAAKRLCDELQIDAISLNCFPHLKSKMCLAVACLNDDGISAGCEGDLHSTILMHLLRCLTGRASFNGDFLRMYPTTNDVLFSHCGAGAFSLATSREDISLRASIETKDGLAVCYPTKAQGTVTLLNMMGAQETFRLAAVKGQSIPTDCEYEGTPMRVHFGTAVKTILQRVSVVGAGHHWNGAFGDYITEFRLLCDFMKIRFNYLTNENES